MIIDGGNENLLSERGGNWLVVIFHAAFELMGNLNCYNKKTFCKS